MDKVYRSKVDWWLGLVISIGVMVILGSSIALLVTPPQEGLPNVWIALGTLAMVASAWWSFGHDESPRRRYREFVRTPSK